MSGAGRKVHGRHSLALGRHYRVLFAPGACPERGYIRDMFTAGQFKVFSTESSERALARAQDLLREGRRFEAEETYQDLIASQPDLKQVWGEYFQLLRSERRFEEALAFATQALQHFGEDAFAVALMGAALVELGRYREALAALEQAADLDPNLGIVWHEAGYAAYRLGEYSRALLALDRAFVLEPHSGTLHLRGKILRNAGRYLAAEVAFSGAAEVAEFAEQRHEAERQLAITRRCAAFPGRPSELVPTRQWFAETGAVLLTSSAAHGRPTEAELLGGFIDLSRAEGWRFTLVVQTDSWAGWKDFAQRLDLPLEQAPDPAPQAVPLVVGRRPLAGQAAWERALRDIRVFRRGLSFVLEQPADVASADVVGCLKGPAAARLDLGAAAAAVQHPECVLRGRRLS